MKLTFANQKKPYCSTCGNFNLDKEDREEHKEAIGLDHTDS